LSCVVHSVRSSDISGGDTAVVMGAGPIGLLHVMVLKAMGLKTIVVEKQKGRINKAKDLKADSVISPDKGDVKTEIMNFTGNKGADVVFECTGIPLVWESALWYVRKGGSVILFGGLKPDARVTYDAARIHYDEITLKGVFHFIPADVANAYKLLSGRKIKVKGLISGKYPLHNLETAFNKLSSGEGIKYAIIP
ncbi:MAG TPA: alcohol dehydrogenase, partial [Nitrospirae bacterium]|nr:alcohol dehydrogenase [Nitrospirota bacterium]